MTVSEAIGQVLLRAGGGRPTADMSVRESDVKAMIAPAANYVMDKGDDKNRMVNDGLSDYLTQFYGEFRSPVDQSGARPFFILEKKTAPLKGGTGLALVYDDCGNYYSPLSNVDMASIKYYAGLLPCNKFYRRIGNKVDLYNESPLTEFINYVMLVDVNELGPDDELPLVAGTEPEFLDVLYALSSGQMANPYDPVIDNDDINKAR
jgi:hypothetical protein